MIGNPRGYINQSARASSWLVPAGTHYWQDYLLGSLESPLLYQLVQAASSVVPAGLGSKPGTYRDRLLPEPGLAKRAGPVQLTSDSARSAGLHNHYWRRPITGAH